ncbi:MAG: transglutaminase-like cysteine peptidase [Nitratireductor sp.]|nr:transglutaminase-like cysteine peptidase [Nitratireductor sp.]
MNALSRALRLAASGFMLTVPHASQALADSPFQRIGNLTSQPIGHYEYCREHREDCNIVSLAALPPRLTNARWEELVAVNIEANAAITPRTDLEIYGVEEHWALPEFYGDCEDYVLMKRKALIDRGWPAHALLPTVVLRPNGEGHAVLTVRTSRGDYVLDNLKDAILRWDQTDYKFLKRVAARHSGRWEDILDSRSIVASIHRSE